jgi:hypothetical protein
VLKILTASQDVEASVIPRQHVYPSPGHLGQTAKSTSPLFRPFRTPHSTKSPPQRPSRTPAKGDAGTVVEFSRLADIPSERIQLVPRRQARRNDAWLPEMSSMPSSLPRRSLQHDVGADDAISLSEDVHIDPIVINPLNGRTSIL